MAAIQVPQLAQDLPRVPDPRQLQGRRRSALTADHAIDPGNLEPAEGMGGKAFDEIHH
jgi:hypothetical protein